MIVVRLDGGLGNQLFQYAAGRQLAARHGASLVLDTSAFDRPSRRVTQRVFELQRFRIDASIATPLFTWKLSLIRRLPPALGSMAGIHAYLERGVQFNPAFDSLPDNTYLVGYWQSHQYFSGIVAEMRA